MPSPLGRLVLCPDVTPGRGLGHLQRSLALGEAWQRAGGEAVVVAGGAPLDAPPGSAGDSVRAVNEITGRIEDAVRERADSAGIPVVEAAPGEADWIVLDGYGVGAADQERARKSARRVGLIDDHGRMGHHDADLVIDQNLGATATPYGPEAGRLLLGPRYALLREALAVLSSAEGTPSVDSGGAATERVLLVTLGGAPSEAAVAFVADTLALLDLTADAVATVGPLGAPTTKRGEYVPSLGNPTDLAAALTTTRVALSAAGSTAWELCATATPAVLVAVADNQHPVGEALANAGAADYLGPVEQADPQQAAAAVDALLADADLWNERQHVGRRLVDGRGADRVATAMWALDVDLRPATADDARTLWDWANDPTVRAAAFDPTPIPWDDHIVWLEARLADRGTSILVATDDGEPWGQVRVGAVGEAEVDVSIAADRRGRGLAGPLLDAAVTQAFRERPGLHRVVARVKADNAASLRAFDRAGFAPADAAADGSDGVVTLHRERADG